MSVSPSPRYSSGRTTGLVLDSGDGVTHSVPVFEGFSMPHAIKRIDLAGRDITEQLQLLMRTAGFDMRTSAEREIVRGIKEEGCFVKGGSSSGTGSSIKEEATRTEEYKLPDGNVVKVRSTLAEKLWVSSCAVLTRTQFSVLRLASSEQSVTWRQKSSSIQSSLAQNILASISSWSIVSTALTGICARVCSATSS